MEHAIGGTHRCSQSRAAKHAPVAMAAPEFAGAAGDFPFYFLPYVSQSFGDGSLAHLPWLQELPDVLTSAMWSSWVEINPKTARAPGHQARRSGRDRIAAGKRACCRNSFPRHRA